MNERRRHLIDAYRANRLAGVEVLLDNVWDRHNVGAVLRSMDGFGIGKVWLYYTYNRLPGLTRGSRKTSAGAQRWIERERVEDIAVFAAEKHGAGWTLVGAEWNEDARSLVEYAFPERCVIVLGAETGGLSPEVRAACDGFVFVPMAGMAESYNVSVAAAVIFYEVFRQRGGSLKLRTELGVKGRGG